MPMTAASEKKKALRADAKQRRADLSPWDIHQKSTHICSSALSLVKTCGTVMIYVSKVPEVDTGHLITHLIANGIHVVVPIIERETTSLRLSYLRDPSVLVESTFRVPEPVGNELPAAAGDLDAVIIPVLGFDRRGNRLGYGAGYYDRFLSHHPGLRKIGLAFSCQESGEIPADENDIRMDIVVTENEIIFCND